MTTLFSRVISRISGTTRKSFFGCLQHRQSLVFSTGCHSCIDSNPKGDVVLQEWVDPFSVVADEISLVSNWFRSSAIAKVLLLMAKATDIHRPESPFNCNIDISRIELCRRQQLIAEITEMIHAASLTMMSWMMRIQDRCWFINFVVGNKLAVLAGDFLLFRALGALAFLKTQSMEYYMQKTYYKTALLISNGCEAIALLSLQTSQVAMLAFEYGKNLGLAYQFIDDILDFTGTSASLGKGSLSDMRQGMRTAPTLFAVEEFPQLEAVVEQGFDNPANVDTALKYLWKSNGIQRTRVLATKHANLAEAAIDSLPENSSMDVRKSRKAVINLTLILSTRNK